MNVFFFFQLLIVFLKSILLKVRSYSPASQFEKTRRYTDKLIRIKRDMVSLQERAAKLKVGDSLARDHSHRRIGDFTPNSPNIFVSLAIQENQEIE
jgi:hypothetical protein